MVVLFSAEGMTEEGFAGLGSRPPVVMFTDVHGRYRFTYIPAGRYYVVASVIVDERPTEIIFRRTFYPNAAGLGEASVIALAEGQKKADADIQLPPQ